MAQYVDGYVLPVAKKNLPQYTRMARKMAKIFLEHGALEVRECLGDDLQVKVGVPFPRSLRIKPGETVLFSWILFKSRAHRDRVSGKVMADPRCHALAEGDMPFDIGRMACGGFKSIVHAS